MRCNLCGLLINDQNICNNCINLNYSKDKNNFHKIFYIFEGFKYIFSDKKIFKLCILPLIITAIISLIIFFSLMYLVFSYLGTYLAENNYSIISKIFFSLLGTLLSSVIVIFSFIPLSTLVAIPFSEPISMEIEKKLLGDKTFENVSIIKGFIESIKIFILKIFIIIFIFPINFIPTIGHIIFSFVLIILSGIDFIDLPMSIKKYSLIEKVEFFKKNFSSYIFFCIPLSFLFWVPIVQIFLIPATIIGATKFFINSEK
ncbi:MAG: hypothetical protein KatS3mg068_0016 [Candidatus Sericytochromatia bacterium]|nr:MAG: hypothetical protein KatS3mg068_0016 [Candidatus Sericytochromatia bacterium]